MLIWLNMNRNYLTGEAKSLLILNLCVLFAACRGRQVAADLAEAVAHLHSLRVVHSDLKSSNVMLSKDMRACVGDLGAALFLGSAAAASALGFSSTHAAPEVLLGERCTLAADIYSLGILLIELTTLTPVTKRGSWRMPSAPHDCPQVRHQA